MRKSPRLPLTTAPAHFIVNEDLPGFVVMLACSMWALTSYRHMIGAATGRGAARPKDRRAGRAAGTGMMERFEERWRRRQERDGR